MSLTPHFPSRITNLHWTAATMVIVIFPLVTHSFARGECADYNQYFHWVDTVSPPGHPYRAAIYDKTACVAAEEGGLSILDIGDPAAMTITSTLPDIYAADVAVVGSHAYVADWGIGLRVVDIHDLSNPVIVGTCNLANIASVTVEGNYAFVTEPVLQTFYVIDISAPEQPSIVGGPLWMPDFPWDTAVQGDFAYVACSYAGVVVVDIREPKDPISIELADTPGIAYAVATDSNCAYVADGDLGLTILKIADPYHVVTIGNLDTVHARDVKLSGSCAVVADLSELEALLAIDVSTPATPQLVGSYRVYYQASGLAVAGTIVLVADGSKLIAFDLASQPEAVPRLGQIELGAQYVTGVDACGTTAYLGRYSGGISVVDMGDPALPTIVGSCSASGSSRALVIDEDTRQVAVAAGNSGLHLFDVADPAHPVRIGSVDTPGYAWDVVRSGTYAYVADGTSGVQVVSLSNPSVPVRVGSLDLPGSGVCKHVALSGGYLFAADTQVGLLVVDISDPASPISVRSVAIPDGGDGVTVAGDHAYVTSHLLWTVDVSDPGAAFLVCGVPLPAIGGDIAVDGGTLYACTEHWGVYLYGIEDPDAPRIVGGVDLQGFPEAVAVSDGRLFVVNQVAFVALPTHCSTPVQVLEAGLSVHQKARRLVATPNPMNAGTCLRLDQPAPAASLVEILDIGGRCVRTLGTGVAAPTQRDIAWDGRDDAGRRVPSGTYFARLVGSEPTAVERIVVIR